MRPYSRLVIEDIHGKPLVIRDSNGQMVNVANHYTYSGGKK
jgi:hypothetical protein